MVLWNILIGLVAIAGFGLQIWPIVTGVLNERQRKRELRIQRLQNDALYRDYLRASQNYLAVSAVYSLVLGLAVTRVAVSMRQNPDMFSHEMVAAFIMFALGSVEMLLAFVSIWLSWTVYRLFGDAII